MVIPSPKQVSLLGTLDNSRPGHHINPAKTSTDCTVRRSQSWHQFARASGSQLVVVASQWTQIPGITEEVCLLRGDKAVYLHVTLFLCVNAPPLR